MSAVDQKVVDTLRFLAVDMVERAKSGHPGLPLGAAPMAYALWSRHMRFDPSRPDWFDRDRFVLSAGHGSALLYALLHVFGYGIGIDDLKNFRQLGSKTPGHPELGVTPGVEVTTGPLGQGFANGVGMAIAEAWLADRYNVGGHKIIDHHTYAIVSDGDLMEGVAQEAASLAGHLKLGKLVYLYDANDISLDGPTDLSFSDDTATRFAAVGWHVERVEAGEDLEAVSAALERAKAVTDKPSLVIVHTVIGFGSPKAGTSSAHGSPLGAEATKATKEKLGWPVEPPFLVPAEATNNRDAAIAKGSALSSAWDEKLTAYRHDHPALAAELDDLVAGRLPSGWDTHLDELVFDKPTATRTAGGKALDAAAKGLAWLVGGAADLSGSTKTAVSGAPVFGPATPGGRNVYYGVREHAMGAVVNGMVAHGLRAYGSTFLVFSDYMRGSVRVAALSQQPSLFVFTHDSVCVGEDGPTHEPVEQVMSLRLVPGLEVYRPADGLETVECWRQALARETTAAIVLSRQDLPPLPVAPAAVRAGVAKGAYVVADGGDVLIAATGSEVSLALAARDALAGKGTMARVVSMPCVEMFRQLPAAERDAIVPPSMPKVSVEAGVTTGWQDILGPGTKAVGIDRFGESAPGEQVYAHLGMTVERVVAVCQEAVKSK
ncbi:MAG: transketolase [Fimbriimonadaceae bacterium]|nr:transketolase [Fimbriimonadaceae bacterium]